MKVLDLGGTPGFWRAISQTPEHVTLVNLVDEPCPEPWMNLVIGDACDPPVHDAFDLVVSNSLIEHVGGHWRREQLSEVVHRSADHHWVQTPYRYFPVEPHWVAPMMQSFPIGLRATISRHRSHGHIHSVDRRQSLRDVLEVELLSSHEMAYYFPDSFVWHERFAGLTKSLVAVK